MICVCVLYLFLFLVAEYFYAWCFTTVYYSLRYLFILFLVVAEYLYVCVCVLLQSEDAQRTFINPLYSTSQNFYDGQITPPSEDSAMWRRSRDLSRFVGRQISKSFSRSQSNMMND